MPQQESPNDETMSLDFLRSALASDALDALGLHDQCLPSGLAPVKPGTVLIGNALPVATRRRKALPDGVDRGLLGVSEAMQAGDVIVVSVEGEDVAVWGELLSTASVAREVAGLVCWGLVRDAAAVADLGFPVIAKGRTPLGPDGRLEILSVGETIEIGGVKIARGDLVVGDDDGVTIVPANIRREAVKQARSRLEFEHGVVRALRSGSSLSEIFAAKGETASGR